MVPVDEKENQWVFDNSVEDALFCSGYQGSAYLWFGADDNDIERRWEYLYTDEEIPWFGPFRGGNPNGGTVENCLVMLHGKFPSKWNDIACLETYSFCVPCEFNAISTVYLKGRALCNTSPFNIEYLINTKINNKPSFTGYLHSDIYWDPEDSNWVLKSLKVIYTKLFIKKIV